MLSGQFDWGDLLPKGNKFFVALLTGDGEVSIRLYAGTSEYPALPVRTHEQVTTRRVRTISRKGRQDDDESFRRNPQRLYAEGLAFNSRDHDTVRAIWRHIEAGRNDRPPTDHLGALARVGPGRASESV